MVFVMIELPIWLHLLACEKLPTALMGNSRPKMNVSRFWLRMLMMFVTSSFTQKANIRRTGPKSIFSEGRQGAK